MDIEKIIDGEKITFKLKGRLDTVTAPELEKELGDKLNGITDITWDFENLEYISSSGLRILLMVQKVMNRQGTMRIINVNESIMDIFEMTGFSGILTIE